MLHCGDGVAARREKERGITKDDMEKDSEKRSTDRKGRPAGPMRGEGEGRAGWAARVNSGQEVVTQREGLDKLRLLPTFASVLREKLHKRASFNNTQQTKS